MNSVRFITLIILISITSVASAAKFKAIEHAEGYEHDKYVTKVLGEAGQSNIKREFRAYITEFDGDDDDNGDHINDFLGVPHYVAYQMKKYKGKLETGPKRPSSWITDNDLYKAGIAPKDGSYRHSRAFLKANPNWYVRGHLCMKMHAWRLGANADWNTHTVLNAVPQRQQFNAGIWLDLEYKTAEWADKFGDVWIIAGPIFKPKKNEPSKWLGEIEKGEKLIAIPDYLFKIIIREGTSENNPEVLAFVYPQDSVQGGPYDHSPYLTSVSDIEEMTGIDFMTALPDDIERNIESVVATTIWE